MKKRIIIIGTILFISIFLTGCNIWNTDFYHIHSLTRYEALNATCTEDGHIEYYKCSICEGIFENAEATIQIIDDSYIIKALGHQFEDSNNICQIAECGLEGPVSEESIYTYNITSDLGTYDEETKTWVIPEDGSLTVNVKAEGLKAKAIKDENPSNAAIILGPYLFRLNERYFVNDNEVELTFPKETLQQYLKTYSSVPISFSIDLNAGNYFTGYFFNLIVNHNEQVIKNVYYNLEDHRYDANTNKLILNPNKPLILTIEGENLSSVDPDQVIIAATEIVEKANDFDLEITDNKITLTMSYEETIYCRLDWVLFFSLDYGATYQEIHVLVEREEELEDVVIESIEIDTTSPNYHEPNKLMFVDDENPVVITLKGDFRVISKNIYKHPIKFSFNYVYLSFEDLQLTYTDTELVITVTADLIRKTGYTNGRITYQIDGPYQVLELGLILQ